MVFDWSILLGWLANAFYMVLVLGCIIVVLSENRNPIRTLAWVIALVFLPYIGIIFYFFLGRSPKVKLILNRRNKRRIMSVTTPPKRDFEELHLRPGLRQLSRLAAGISISPMTIHNRLEIFTEGLTKFETLKHDLRHAESSIYLQYYIFSDDPLGQEIADILIERAQAGVTVKVIYDHVGSFSARRRFFKRMRRGGVDAQPFFRVTFPQLANRINWRNHRKIAIVDGIVGYIGGMNIASRYIEGYEGRVWRDTHFRVEGEIVKSLTASFMIDWGLMHDEFTDPVPARPVRMPESLIGMQLITSAPTEQWDNLSLTFLTAISGARKRIYIQTPYFLPTEGLHQALIAAALSGIDIRIMIPEHSDSKVLRYASFSYIKQCLQAGIKVYLYQPGMLHSKNMIIDDDFVTSGSTNFDFRSLENNFECNLLIYSREANERMREIFFSDLKSCTKISMADWVRRPVTQRAMESLLRLLSPIL